MKPTPRARLLERGPAALDDAELLTVAMGGGASGLASARRLIAATGGLRRLLSIDRARLRAVGLSDRASAVLLALVELSRRTLRLEHHRPLLDRPAVVVEYVRAHHLELDQEVMGALYLDARQQLLGERVLFRGQLCRLAVEPRQILRHAIEIGAPHLALWHTHPSGDPAPSAEDLDFTKRIAEAGELLGVALVDHLIIGDTGAWVSLAQRCLL